MAVGIGEHHDNISTHGLFTLELKTMVCHMTFSNHFIGLSHDIFQLFHCSVIDGTCILIVTVEI